MRGSTGAARGLRIRWCQRRWVHVACRSSDLDLIRPATKGTPVTTERCRPAGHDTTGRGPGARRDGRPVHRGAPVTARPGQDRFALTQFGEEHGVSDAAQDWASSWTEAAAPPAAAGTQSLIAQFDRVAAEQPERDRDRGRPGADHLRPAAGVVCAHRRRGRDAPGGGGAPGWRRCSDMARRRSPLMLGSGCTLRPFMNLDPTLPDARLVYMLETAGAGAVLVADPGSARVVGLAGVVPRPSRSDLPARRALWPRCACCGGSGRGGVPAVYVGVDRPAQGHRVAACRTRQRCAGRACAAGHRPGDRGR